MEKSGIEVVASCAARDAEPFLPQSYELIPGAILNTEGDIAKRDMGDCVGEWKCT